MEPVLDETLDLDEFRIRFVGAFGTTEQIIAEAFFQQVVNALHPDPKKPLERRDRKPRPCPPAPDRPAGRDRGDARLPDDRRALLPPVDTGRRALHVEANCCGRGAYLSLARKLMTLYTAQMDALRVARPKR